jgi:hypothetical protein
VDFLWCQKDVFRALLDRAEDIHDQHKVFLRESAAGPLFHIHCQYQTFHNFGECRNREHFWVEVFSFHSVKLNVP